MVLIISNEKSGEERKVEKDYRYAFTVQQNNVAVFYDSVSNPIPSNESVEEQLQNFETPNQPTFFVTPFEGLRENSEDTNALNVLLSNVGHYVSRRENVTLINRGVSCDQYLEQLLLSLLEAVKGSAEYAMQIVADEIAKEKQMQRLLQLDGDDGAETRQMIKKVHEDNTNMKAKTLPLSKKLRGEIKQLSREYNYEPQQSRSTLKERYTVLSSVHGEDLRPPVQHGSTLAPATCVEEPPQQRKATVIATTEKGTRSQSSMFDQKKRKSTLGLLANLNATDDTEDVPLTGNGWGPTTRMFVFNGESSIMSLPGVPKFEDMVRSFAVDFWIRTDCKAREGKRILFQILEGQREDLGQLFQIGLNWYEEMDDCIRVMCRDSTNRVLEVLIPLHGTGVTDGTSFHHVMIEMGSVDEGRLECRIDGREMELQVLQQEHPIAFNPWPHRLFVGGYLDESNAPACVFRGTLMQLRFWTLGDTRKPALIWPLLVRDGKLIELTKTIPEDHHETLQNLQRTEEPSPSCSPFFDGNLVVNMGTLAVWGELMHNWRVEIRFRTDVTGKMMNLIGVTDQKYQMQEFGIVLNAEPVFTKERVRYNQLNTTFYVVDAFGACCSALLRGNDRQCLMDGQWHTLVWRCIDSESNKFSVKVDGVFQDLLYVSRDGPHRFDSFENWVCLGGHNVRNWKTKRPFEGQICRFFVSVRSYRFVTLHMDEGPGAYVLQDKSGHRNHGLLINAETNAVRKSDTLWMPAEEQKEEEEAGPKLDVVIYKNNKVSIAAVVFGCTFNDKGVSSEALHNVFTGDTFDLDVVEQHVSDKRKEWKTWRAIPEQCYRPLDSVTQLEDAVNDVLHAQVPRGHMMVVIRIGDCFVTLLHVQEVELPKGSTYNCNMLKWHYPYMVEGVHGRRELLLNRMVEAMEGVLVCDTLTPFTTAKLGPLNTSGSQSIVSEDIIRTLQNSGKPWYLASVLHHNLLNSEYGSSLHIVHRIFPRMTYDEAAAVALFNKKLHDGTKEKASLVIQRNWKGKLAKMQATKKGNERQLQDRKVEEIRTFRMNPAVQARATLTALIITLTRPKCAAVPPLVAPVDDLIEALQKQGYTVEHLDNVPLPSLTKIVSQVDTDKCNFIFIVGYGGIMNLKQPPIFALQSLHLSLQEGAARAAIALESGKEYRRLMSVMKAEQADLKPAKKKKAAKATNVKKKKPDEIEAEQRQFESECRAALNAVEQGETFSRDAIQKEWENEVLLLSKTIRQSVVATRDFEAQFRPAEGKEPSCYLYPCECGRIEPYANHVLDVEDVIRAALHRQAPPIGLQSIIAFDLAPITPYAQGMSCIASSTGNTLRVVYKPQQKLLATNTITKAFNGLLPQVSATGKYAILSGGIETASNQRDWKSFASYYLTKLRDCCTTEQYRALREELDREVPFTAELIPVRQIILTDDVRERMKRDNDAQKVNVQMTFGVGNLKVQSDMFSVFRNILGDIPLSEITFVNQVNFLFTESNKGIDGIQLSQLEEEIEKLRPERCAVPISLRVTADGARLTFESQDSSDRLSITQWLNSIVVRSLTWQIESQPLEGYRRLDIDYTEYLYSIKTTCSLLRFTQLQKQQCKEPIPQPHIRFLDCELIKKGDK